MKTPFRHTFIVLAIIAGIYQAKAQGTTFTYQGRLADNGQPANGVYGMVFYLCDNPTSGGQLANLGIANVPVTNGLFTVSLDFGAGSFPGADRWLEITVKTNGAATFTTLSPRQQLTPTPYAITASNLSGTLPAAQLSGQLVGGQIANGAVGVAQIDNTAVQARVTGTAPTGEFITGIAANGSVTVASDTTDWKLGGNNVTPGQFLGSTNNQPVELKVNGQRALRLESDAFGFGAPNVIGGSSLNYVAPGTVGAVIAGGGAIAYAFFAESNSVAADFGAIGGGFLNKIQSGSINSVIGGGDNNEIQSSAPDSTISGGVDNQIQASAWDATIGGGFLNIISQHATNSTISGGDQNTVLPYAINAVIGGGSKNSVTTYFDTIGGGISNTINGAYGFIGGGESNTVAYPFTHDVIGGGVNNTAGGYFAVIGGGHGNQTGEQGAVISGGQENTASGWGSAILGGNNNSATGSGSSIVGGSVNTASGQSSTVGGGEQNYASGTYAAIPGGNLNVAQGSNSFAAGHWAKAFDDGTFVWADSQNSAFISTANNQFLIRAAGGVGINTNNPGATLDVNGSIRVGAGTTVFKNLQGGIAQMASGSSTVKTNFTFTFPKAFSTVPKVLISPASGNSVPVDDTFAVSVRVLTATTCTVNIVRVDNPSGWSQQVKINWLAWE